MLLSLFLSTVTITIWVIAILATIAAAIIVVLSPFAVCLVLWRYRKAKELVNADKSRSNDVWHT